MLGSMLSPYSVVCFFCLIYVRSIYFFFFFFNDTATTEIYTLSLHDALPISASFQPGPPAPRRVLRAPVRTAGAPARADRSEEHTSELQSRLHLVCRLLLEKKKKNIKTRRCLNDRIVHFETTLLTMWLLTA